MSTLLDQSRVLVVAATARELAAGGAWARTVCGVGPVEAAAATAAAIAQHRPAAVLHVGIAGARRVAGLAPGTLVVGTEAVYCDLSPSNTWCPRLIATDAALVSAAREAVSGAVAMAIGTSARVGGTAGCDVEAMEGFAVLRAAQMAGVAAVEVRAISNEVEERDRARWYVDLAFDTIARATPALVAALVSAVPGGVARR